MLKYISLIIFVILTPQLAFACSSVSFLILLRDIFLWALSPAILLFFLIYVSLLFKHRNRGGIFLFKLAIKVAMSVYIGILMLLALLLVYNNYILDTKGGSIPKGGGWVQLC